jgi:hypothetical protein
LLSFLVSPFAINLDVKNVRKEGVGPMKNLHKLLAIGAVALAAILYYVLVLGKHAEKVQYIGGR